MRTSSQLLDEAYELMREVMHRHTLNPEGRSHCSLAMAFCREAWIDADGQTPQTPDAVFAAHSHFRALEAALVARDDREEGGAA